MLNFTSDQWVIVALIFILGLLVGGFLFSGGGRKWKQRYNSEVSRRHELEKSHALREKEWRDAERNRPVAVAPVAARDSRDINNDGVVSPAEKSPGLVDRVLGRDRDRDGTPDNRDPVDNRKL
jgi:hypothetical protein